ncbi:hypothetical protein K440DRAFT_661270 [Wilcoxina mikolae CBS 423.85]|nr:hypothetical protein K440DRAFT_661270 [Wilcoxina mikolae CBS 423.85]
MAKQKKKEKGSSADNLRKVEKSSDGSQTKEPPAKDSPVNEPSPQGPLVVEAPQKEPSTKDPPATGEKLPDASLTRVPSTKARKLPVVDPNNKLYFPPRDRNSHTGRDYIPAGSPRGEWATKGEYVPAGFPRGEWATKGEYPPAPLGRHYIPAASGRLYHHPRSMESSFSVGPAAIRQLEVGWSGVDGDTSHSPNSRPTQKGPLAMENFLHTPMESLRISTPEPGRQISDQSESGPKFDIEQRSPWIPPHQRKRKSEEMGVLPRNLVEEVEVLKRSKTSTDQQDTQVPAIAVFENGMRKTPGKGRMNSDYTGVVLPLLDEFMPTATSPACSPWLIPEQKDYNSCSEGTVRLTAEMLDFVDYMARDDLEIFGREQFTHKIIRSIQEYFSEPGVEVSIFGSDATGLGLPTSDIDIMINAPSLYNPNPYMARELKIGVLYELQQHFLDNCIFVRSTVRDEAHIPILEMEDLETGLEVDISFEEPYSKHALNNVQQWNMKYGHQELIPLILLFKHSLNMRKLGLGSATMPYQGGVGSYILMCMVIVYLEVKMPELVRVWRSLGQAVNYGRILLGMLKFWGMEFDYETQAIMVNPPAIIPKSPYLPPFIFEVRSPFDNTTNIAAGAFGIKHVKETLKHFYYTLLEGVQEYDRNKNSRRREGIQTGWHPPVANDLGILGRIIAGNYTAHEQLRSKIVQAALRAGHPIPRAQQPTKRAPKPAFWMNIPMDSPEAPRFFPPHIRVLSGGSPQSRIPKAGPYTRFTQEQFTTEGSLL